MRLTEKQKRYLPLKRAADVILSGGAIVILSPVLLGISVAIKLDSKGPVLFKQKRVGKNKELFKIWKFRSMYTETPRDLPTHQLENPAVYITKIGRFLRKTSLDELPQIFNIFRGQMSIIGPRPALWNQDDLVAERDKYGANDVTPGLTGWAQINGRDELEIPVKARLDGEYVEKMGLWMDLKCFLGTIGSVLSSNGVVEGGTGEMRRKGKDTERDTLVSPEKLKKEMKIGTVVLGACTTAGGAVSVAIGKHLMGRKESKEEQNHSTSTKVIVGITVIAGTYAALYKRSKTRIGIYKALCDSGDNRYGRGCGKHANFFMEKAETNRREREKQKSILITGANSYIGMSVEKWLNHSPDAYHVDTLDMISEDWRSCDFSKYDVVYHVAGIAHADVGCISEEQKQLYYKVNTELAVEAAEKSKAAGVKQFIFMSSMIIYSGCKEKIITAETQPKPLNVYEDSKWQADQKIRVLADENFKVVVLRPPMIYGKGSKGNYPTLAKLASILPIFPEVRNKRSMLYIDNLCQFVKLMIDNEESGVFFPQNMEYTNTSDMVQMIAAVNGHTIVMIPWMTLPARLAGMLPGKIGGLASKVFGDYTYDMRMSEYKNNYWVRTLAESISQTELKDMK